MRPRSTGSEPRDTGGEAGLARRRRPPAGRCYNCQDCSLQGRARFQGQLVVAGAVVLNLLSFGLMQSLVSRCAVCRHRTLRHRLQRGRLAASQAADTVEFPLMPE